MVLLRASRRDEDVRLCEELNEVPPGESVGSHDVDIEFLLVGGIGLERLERANQGVVVRVGELRPGAAELADVVLALSASYQISRGIRERGLVQVCDGPAALCSRGVVAGNAETMQDGGAYRLEPIQRSRKKKHVCVEEDQL